MNEANFTIYEYEISLKISSEIKLEKRWLRTINAIDEKSII